VNEKMIGGLAKRYQNNRAGYWDLFQVGVEAWLSGENVRSKMFDAAYSPNKNSVFGGCRASPRLSQWGDRFLVSREMAPGFWIELMELCSPAQKLICVRLIGGETVTSLKRDPIIKKLSINVRRELELLKRKIDNA